MKRLLVMLAALLLITSCALAQSEMPKLHLSEIKDTSKITHHTEWYTVYQSGSVEDNTFLEAKYDYYGDLEVYDYSFDCGCIIVYYANGKTYDRSKCPEGLTHTAPVVHAYKLGLLDQDVLTALNKLTGKKYTYDYIKTPVPLGSVKAESGTTFILADKGYDDVIMYDDSVDEYAPFDAEYSADNGGSWTVNFWSDTKLENIRICVKQGEKLTYYKDGNVQKIAFNMVFEYFPEQETFWLDGGHRYNSTAEYGADGQMYGYGYKYSKDGYEWFMRYNMRNELQSMAYDLPNGDHWFYSIEDGWQCWAYRDSQYRKKTPTEDIVAAILPPIAKQTYEVPVVSDVSEMKKTDVPFVLADAATLKELEKEGLSLGVTAYPPQEEQIRYELSWVNDEGEKVSGKRSVDVVLAWPYGLDLNWAKNHEFVVEHEMSSGKVQIFSTMDGTAQRTEHGLKIHTTFSPFVMNWGTEQEMQQIVNAHASVPADMPSTGDDSMILLWAGMLMISVCAYAAGRKARA